MAPVAPLGRDAAIRLVLTGAHTAIVEQDGVSRIRELRVDPAEVATMKTMTWPDDW